jgi:broad specificity phosphatase PhoE
MRSGNPTSLLSLFLFIIPQLSLSLTVKLYLVRHCISTFNAMSIPAGFKYDPVLSEQGREQAEMVGREFGRALEGEGGGPATILTSGEEREVGSFVLLHFVNPPSLFSEYKRAMGTGTIINEHIGRRNQNVLPTGLLNEVNFGFEGMDPTSGGLEQGLNKVEYKNLVKRSFRTWSNPNTMHASSAEEGAESGREVMLRAQSAISEMCARAAESPSLSCIAVSHSSFLRAMLSVLQGEDLASMYR